VGGHDYCVGLAEIVRKKYIISTNFGKPSASLFRPRSDVPGLIENNVECVPAAFFRLICQINLPDEFMQLNNVNDVNTRIQFAAK
jgi:hypothetical protein